MEHLTKFILVVEEFYKEKKMVKYAKYINEDYIELPPQNMPNRLFNDGTVCYVSNYDKAEDLLIEDGYIRVEEVPMPEQENPKDVFIKKYKLHDDYIEVYWENQYVAPTLEEIKIQKIEDINLYRKDDYQDSSVIFEKNKFPVDDTFFIEVNGALISQELTHEFKAKEKNEYVELDLIQVAQLQRLINEERRAIYDYSQVIKNKVRESKTIEEVESITYNRKDK